MSLKVVYELLLRSYEHFQFFRITVLQIGYSIDNFLYYHNVYFEVKWAGTSYGGADGPTPTTLTPQLP